jgi:ribosomal protein S18 acetylase RimI-like enzyme
MSDAETVLALYHAVSMAMVGEIEEDLQDILLEWEDPEVDLNRDTRIVHDSAGRLVGYGIISGHAQYPFLDIYIQPDLWGSDPGVEAYLFNWAVWRARENAALIPADHRLALRAYTHSHDERYKTSLEAAGLRVIRHSFQMANRFEEPPVAPPLPDGFRLRLAARDEDWRAIYDVKRDAWRDHFGNVEDEYEKDFAYFKHYWERFFAPGCWLLAETDDTIAGICLCEPTHNEDETYGWITTLAVRRDYRKRGLAGALLRQAFAALYAIGRRSVGLGVDARSLTNAVRLYENAGMHVKQRYDLYELELRPGVDTAVS